jgi:hypothetical protein
MTVHPAVLTCKLPSTLVRTTDAEEYLRKYLGLCDNPTTAQLNQLNAVLSIVAAQAKSYTRGVGWIGPVPTDDICAVVISASARLLGNLSGLKAETMGALSVQYGPPFGWSLAERSVLDKYRVKAL